MKMNRRNVLLGLGTVVAGGGAALGTGAFSSVEADREVSLETTGDAGALLELEILSDTLQGAAGDSDDVIDIDVDDLNLDALTTFEGALRVGNNSDDPIYVYVGDGVVGDEIGSNADNVLRNENDVGDLDDGDAPGIYLIVDDGDIEDRNDEDAIVLEADGGDDTTEVDIVVNTLGEEDSSSDPLDGIDSLLFEANDDSS